MSKTNLYSKNGPLISGRNRDRLLAGSLVLGGALGLFDIWAGKWKPGPGVGNHLVPMIAYWVLVFTGLAVFKNSLLEKTSELSGSLLKLAPIPLAIGLVWAGLYFIAVRQIGIAVSTAAFIGTAIWLLSSQKERNALHICIIAICSGGIFWTLFTLMAPILIKDSALF